MRFAIDPLVEAFARLLAKFAGFDEGVETRTAGVVAEDAGDVSADVEADAVGQFDRSHRHAEGAHGLVDLFFVLALFQAGHGGEHVGGEHFVDEEARNVLRNQREFADGGDECGTLVDFGAARAFALHDFDEGHHGDGGEEVQADEAGCVLHRLGDVGEFQG